MGTPRLQEVLSRIEASVAKNRPPMCVFDLDSTLFSTGPRNLRILREFVEDHAHQHPDLEKMARGIGIDDMGWNIHESLAKRGLADQLLLEKLRGFWMERFFTDEYCFVDSPTPGAASFVSACHERGATIYYLTGRHVGGMEIGTVRALTEHGFPYWRGRSLLHLKPSFEMPDKDFKDLALEEIRSHGCELVATFENEPGNANLFVEAFPQALHFLLLTVTSPEPEDPFPELIPTPDFHLASVVA